MLGLIAPPRQTEADFWGGHMRRSPEPEEGGLQPPPIFLAVAVLQAGDDRNNFHIVGADDYHLVFINGTEEAAPLGLDPHKCLGHRDDMNSLARNYRSDSDVEVDVTDPRRAMALMTVVRISVRCCWFIRTFTPAAACGPSVPFRCSAEVLSPRLPSWAVLPPMRS